MAVFMRGRRANEVRVAPHVASHGLGMCKKTLSWYDQLHVEESQSSGHCPKAGSCRYTPKMDSLPENPDEEILVKSTFVIVALSMLVSTVAGAQDNCSALLRHGIYNHFQQLDAASSQSYIRSQLCSAYSEYVRNGRSGGANATYAAFSGSAQFSSDEIRSIGNAMCKDDVSASDARNLARSASRVISETGALAYRDCIAHSAAGLTVATRFSDSGLGSITIDVSYRRPPGARGPGPSYNGIVMTPANAYQCSGSLFNLPVGTRLSNDVKTLHCVRRLSRAASTGRRVPGQLLAAQADVVVQTGGRSITRSLPAMHVPDPNVRANATQFVLGALPTGTILGMSSVTEAPPGWRICDGEQGTPDLRGRFVVGAGQGYALGSTGGRTNIPTDGSHAHRRRQISGAGYGDDRNDNQYDTHPAGAHNHGGDNHPPFHAITFMCRVSD